MPLSQVAAPSSLPVTLASAKLHLLVGASIDDEDDEISQAIAAATERAEIATQRAVMLQTWDFVLDGFPHEGWIELPRPPLVSVTSVKYVDPSGAIQTWAPSPATGGYLVDAPAGPRCRRGRVCLPFAGVWPVTIGQAASVTVRFTCGYASASAVPALLKTAIFLDIGTLFANREGILTSGREQAVELPMGVREIYRQFRSHGTQRSSLAHPWGIR
jgi:uncharacterized phiE125 gp8 family phage protein